MNNGVFLALLSKMVEEKFNELPVAHRGPRGFVGARGEDGTNGRDGKDFVFEEHEETIRNWAREFALKFEDLSDDQIHALRGPRGERGRDGRDGAEGKSFSFEENKDRIDELLRAEVERLSPEFKLKFSDLSLEDKEELRGPRGQRGKPGKDFVFAEHEEYFKTLKPKFSDFTPEEKAELTLRFAHLSDEERDSLKLKFRDLTDEDKLTLRGSRGQRGRPGNNGEKGDSIVGPRGARGPAGLIGLTGLTGLDGQNGLDGRDGLDAPHIISIDLQVFENKFRFAFDFSDGSREFTPYAAIPARESYFFGGLGGSGGSDGGGSGTDGKSAYDLWLEAGNTGAVEDFLFSLIGNQGPQGDPGPSSFNGFRYQYSDSTFPPDAAATIPIFLWRRPCWFLIRR